MFYRVQELQDAEAAEDIKLRKVAGDMLKNAASDPKLSKTEFMKYVANLASDEKSNDWADEFLHKVKLFFLFLTFFFTTSQFCFKFTNCPKKASTLHNIYTIIITH